MIYTLLYGSQSTLLGRSHKHAHRIDIIISHLNLSVAIRSLQVAVIARSSLEISQTVRNDINSFSHAFASQYSLAIILKAKTPTGEDKTYRQRDVETASTWTATIDVDRQRHVKTAITRTSTTAVITATDWVKAAGGTFWFMTYCIAHTCVVFTDYCSVCDAFAIYDNNRWHRLIIINIRILY